MPIPLEIALHEGFARICGPVKQWPRTWSVLMAAFIGVGSFLGGANGQTAAIPPIAAGAPTQANPAPIATGSEDWSLHVQTTVIEQWDYGFNSPYAGPNSFLPGPEEERTFSFTLYLGRKLWDGAEFYYNPEILQGHGLSSTLGIAGFPNGEAVKAAFYNFHYNTSRLYLRQTFGLGGETEKIEDDENQLSGTVDVNRITLSLGKFAANDFFDQNAYSHDSRTQFLNWALWESAAWDYPADVIGYTGGFVAEYNTKNWMIHYGIFMEPTEANGATLDPHLAKAWGQVLQFDRTYTLDGHDGTIRPFVFWNRADMGNYSDAVAEPSADVDITKTRTYRSKVGFGLSWDQELTSDLGVFARLSWDDGRTESFAFTEIDQSAALGVSMKGTRWGRADDTLGVAGVVSGLSSEHRAYLAAGGIGLILGDGRLNYGLEQIVEAYYDIKVCRWLRMAPDFQYVWNPGFNSDRGPVPVYAVRAHVEF
jgi:high affinity Mn2+ porin